MPMRNFRSAQQQPNEYLTPLERAPGTGNTDWIRRASLRLRECTQFGSDCTLLLLIGGTDVLHARLRFAQSPMRDDRTPGRFSHVALLQPRAKGGFAVHEISLDPPGGFGYAPRDNAVQVHDCARYDSVDAFPNLALFAIPAPEPEVFAQVQAFRRQSGVIDATAMLLDWLAYGWAVQDAANPLRRQRAMPCAAFVESVIGPVWGDLSPGLASDSTCPEAIWQGLRWWSALPRTGVWRGAPPAGVPAEGAEPAGAATGADTGPEGSPPIFGVVVGDHTLVPA